MKTWTRFDILLVIMPLALALLLGGHRIYEHVRYERAADQVEENITEIATAVSSFHYQTGNWFPAASNARQVRVYLDPFHVQGMDYQGLDQELLWRENNFGMVLQLVRFDPALDRAIPIHIFDVPFETGEPYLRVLIDYGANMPVEREILLRVQSRLPDKSLAEIDDHYYVIDLRRLVNDA